MRRPAALLVALALAGAARAESPSDDVLVTHAFVPSSARRVGEVRIVQRGDAAVIQTLLYTSLLQRAVDAIHDKESANWPAHHPEHADARRYRAALDAQAARVLAAPAPDDRRRRLLIEFVLDGDAATVVVGDFDMAGDGDAIRVTARRPVETLSLSPAYVRRNMQLIVADAFDLPPDGIAPVLGPLAPVLAPTPP